MNCLFLIDTLEVGGTERSILELTSRFEHIRPTVVHLFKGDALKSMFRARGITVISLDLSSPFSFFECFRAVKKIIQTQRPDLIVSHLYWSEFYTRLACLGNPAKVIGTFVNDSYSYQRFCTLPLSISFKLRVYQFIDRLTAKRCQGFIANSETVARSNAKALGVNRSKIMVIYRGRDSSTFRETFKLKPESLNFVNVGRLIQRKGHAELLRAFSVIVQRYPKSKLSIAGEGYNRPILEKLIEVLGIADSVVLLGQVQNIPELLYNSDFFVFPSQYEGFSGALIEAMFVGMPIIASDIEMNKEALDHGLDGYLYPCNSHNALVDAMIWTIENRTLGYEMGRIAKEKAFRRFDIEGVSKQTEEYLHSFGNAHT